jgi:CMP-N,N'-diacetyllegionaminic acid synthase
MKILITICARSGSKGLVNKNIREIDGKPLIAYSFESAKKWGKAHRIVCSSDSKKILEIAKKYGINVPFIRPDHLASDEVGKVDVIRHAAIQCEKKYNETYDIIVDLDVTAPIRSKNNLEECLNLFLKKKPDILFSVVNARKNPYFNMVEEKEDGYVKIVKPLKTKVLSRQNAPKVYDINASIYFYNKNFLFNENNKTVTSTDKAAIYVMDDLSAIDIDKEIEFKFVEFLIKNKEVKL